MNETLLKCLGCSTRRSAVEDVEQIIGDVNEGRSEMYGSVALASLDREDHDGQWYSKG